MLHKMEGQETYLGDGLYASFDGCQFKLRAPREDGDHEVYLEPATYNALVRFVASTCRARGVKPNDDAEIPTS